MPPRYAYWTIIVDNQPTAFRAGAKEDLLPTFNRLKQKQPSATMMWFQNGKLWPSRLDAQEAMRARGEMGRRGDERQAGGFRDRERRPARFEKPDWKPRTSRPQDLETSRPESAAEKLDWKPKGEFTPAPKRSEKPDWKPKGSFKPGWKPKGFTAEGRESRRGSFSSQGGKPKASFDQRKPEWKPKGSFDRERKPEWKAKGASADRDRKPGSFARPDWKPSGDDAKSAKPEWKPKGSFSRERKPDWKPKGSFDRDRKPAWKPKGFAADGRDARRSSFSSEGGKPRAKPAGEKLDWKPKAESGIRNPEPRTREKRAWVPKAEYKKSLGIEAKRDDKWRPGGEHRDPKQKYKDAKKAKWSKFKKNIRQNWEKKAGKKSDK